MCLFIITKEQWLCQKTKVSKDRTSLSFKINWAQFPTINVGSYVKIIHTHICICVMKMKLWILKSNSEQMQGFGGKKGEEGIT